MSIAKKAGSWSAPSSSKLVPVAPESYASNVAKKRKRLAKAFARPLDKKIKGASAFRVKLSMRDDEYLQLLDLQRRLAGQRGAVKKGELLRAGLRRLAELDADDFQQALAAISAVG